MDIVSLRSSRRLQKIAMIKESIIQAVDRGGVINYGNMLLEVSSKQAISLRTAHDYIKVILFELKLKVVKGEVVKL